MILLSLLTSTILGQAAIPDCRQPDAAMLALPLHEFDQTPAGWRSLDAEGCEAVGADAIAEYREINRETLAGEDLGTLIWHEGQLRAAAGQADAARLKGVASSSNALKISRMLMTPIRL